MLLLPILKTIAVSTWLFLLAGKDWKTRTLPNYLTMGGAVVILVWRLGWGGVGSFGNGLLGGVIGALLLFIPFLLRAAGAGDIKFLFAVGTLVGVPKIFATLFLICVMGVVLGFCMMLAGRLDSARMKHLFNCLFNFRYDRQKAKETLPEKEAEQVRIPFGVAISAGAFLSLCLELFFIIQRCQQ